MIEYRLTNDKDKYIKSKQIIDFLVNVGMDTYGNSLKDILSIDIHS